MKLTASILMALIPFTGICQTVSVSMDADQSLVSSSIEQNFEDYFEEYKKIKENSNYEFGEEQLDSVGLETYIKLTETLFMAAKQITSEKHLLQLVTDPRPYYEIAFWLKSDNSYLRMRAIYCDSIGSELVWLVNGNKYWLKGINFVESQIKKITYKKIDETAGEDFYMKEIQMRKKLYKYSALELYWINCYQENELADFSFRHNNSEIDKTVTMLKQIGYGFLADNYEHESKYR